MAAGRERQRPRRASRGRGEAEQEARQRTDEVQEQAEEQGPRDTEDRDGSDSGGGIFSELRSTASEAALAVLAPAAKQAATQAAKYALKKGPELMTSKVIPKVAEAGGPGGIAESVMDGGSGLLSKLGGDGDEDGGGRGTGDGTGKGRRMPIQQAVDVAAPIDVVYDQFTQFEDWPKFMHRVERVEQKDDATVTFHEKIWAFRRHWDAEIVEQRPDERIVWESTSGMQHVGVVTFHELAERLTRVEVNIDIDPEGPIEKIARGARFAKRAARADLARFKAFVEMREDETGAWRGEIRDGEVVSEDDGYEDEMSEEREDDLEYEDDEREFEDEDEMESEPEDEMADDDDEDEDEEQEAPKPRRKPKAKARGRASSNGSSKSANGSSKSASGRSRSSSSSTSRSRSRGSSNGSSKSKSGSSKAKTKS